MRRLAILLLLLFPNSAFAWGQEGHRIIATLASQRLTPAARAEVKSLLRDNPDGKSLPAVSNWADWVRYRQMPETYRWHFVDIPLSRDTYDPARDCPKEEKGDCIIAAVERMQRVLADRRRPRLDRVEALKFLVHLVGDLHQPLHVAERDDDLGGNKVKVIWFGAEEHRMRDRRQAWTLHAVWDDGMIAATERKASRYVVRLNAWLAGQDEAALRRGSVVDWALEAHALARSQVYRDADGTALPRTGARLGRPYLDARIAALDAQLARAGVRLAVMLNEGLKEQR